MKTFELVDIEKSNIRALTYEKLYKSGFPRFRQKGNYLVSKLNGINEPVELEENSE